MTIAASRVGAFFFALGATSACMACSSEDGNEPSGSGSAVSSGGTASGGGTSAGGGGPSTGGGGPSSGGAGPSSGGGTPGTGGGGPGSGETFDCSTIANPPRPTILGGLAANRGIAFDDAGLMITGTRQGLFRSTARTSEVIAPGLDASRGQIRRLPDGDFVVAQGSEGGLVRVTPAGAQSTIHPEWGHYSVRVGPDGMLYASQPDGERTRSQVARIDPSTGDAEVILELANAGDHDIIRDVDFNPEGDVLYLATEGSLMFSVELDSSLNPTGPATEFVDVSPVENEIFSCGDACKIEAITVDICGNIYATLLLAQMVVRISSDGADIVQLYDIWDGVDVFSVAPVAHGLSWGPANSAEFNHDSLYLALPFVLDDDGDPLPSVSELQVGVPPRTWGGTAINK